MIYYTAEELAVKVPEMFGIKAEQKRKTAGKQSFLHTDIVRRICHICEISHSEERIPAWAREALVGDKSPLDLLLGSEDELRMLDGILCDMFRESGPHTIFSSCSPEMDDPEHEAWIVSKILRLIEDQDRIEIFDPLSDSDKPIDKILSRISEAIIHISNVADGKRTRFMLVAGMRSKKGMIRTRSIIEADRFLGFEEIATSLEMRYDDQDALIRMKAVDSLAVMSFRPEIQARLASFVGDRVKEVRMRVVNAIQGKAIPADLRLHFAPLAFDPCAEIRDAASELLPEVEKRAYIENLKSIAVIGGELNTFDMILLASTSLLTDVEKKNIFVQRLAITYPRRHEVAAFTDTIVSLCRWNGIIHPDVWAHLDEMKCQFDSYEMEKALVRALQKADLNSPWPVMMRVLRSPITSSYASGDPVILREITAEKTVSLADFNESKIEELLQLLLDKDCNANIQHMILHCLGKVGSLKNHAELLLRLFFDAGTPVMIKRSCLMYMALEVRTEFEDRILEEVDKSGSELLQKTFKELRSEVSM